MILQSIIWSDQACMEQEMYYRAEGDLKIDNKEITIFSNTKISTNTYINIFDYQFWKKYTVIDYIALKIDYKGKGKIRICSISKNSREVISEYKLNHTKMEEEYFYLNNLKDEKLLFFEIYADEDICIKDASYYCEQKGNHTHLSLIICTYKRKSDIERNKQQLLDSLFFDEKSEYYGKLDVCIVDNGSELKQINEKYIKIVHNPNTGGSGGFTRGILETRKVEEIYKTTQVIFMDDDVVFMNESLYRLYALISILKEEYRDSVVSGRMFRMDDRKIQYTASEIWNSGEIIHIDGNQNMNDEKNLLSMNWGIGEYTGWWFGCFPMNFIRENLPFPFFLHCDDVEYGLRHSSAPIVLNGIQVWHETYEYRISPMIVYYDIRNSMIVNTIYCLKRKEKLLEDWKKTVGHYHSHSEWKYKYYSIWAMLDYLFGNGFLARCGKISVIELENDKVMRFVSAILYRFIIRVFDVRYRKITNKYKFLIERYKK